MDDITELVNRARLADTRDERVEAFGQIVRRFQDMACGYAYSILGDFHLAEDAAQEAFVATFRQLNDLRQPEAFAGWFRRIIWSACGRFTRRAQLSVISLDVAAATPSASDQPAEALEKAEMRDAVLRAINELSSPEREATTLFYINGYSQQEVADFLEVPVATVKNRLIASRGRLKERMLNMVKDTLHENAPGERFNKKVIDELLSSPRPLEIEGHPIRQVWEEVRSAYDRWKIVEGPEIEAASRWSQSLRASGGEYGAFEFGADRLLRVTTTSTIIDAMQGRTPPFQILCAGRVFRNDGPDAKHYPVFHQASGAKAAAELDEARELESLRQVLERLAGAGRVVATEHKYSFVRTRGWELQVEEDGRRQGLAGAGLLRPEVLAEAGLNAEQVQVFAFGFGLEALVLWRMKLDDIRKLWQLPYVV